MTTAARARYKGHRFPAEIIGRAVWLYFRFPLGLRMVEELLAARGAIISHETVRQWVRKFRQRFENLRRNPVRWATPLKTRLTSQRRNSAIRLPRRSPPPRS
jgi:putative transposase